MGNQHNKDPNIDIYMEVQKESYRAGETVQGNIYLRARKHLAYSELILKFQGFQNCSWTEQKYKLTHTEKTQYVGNKQIYKNNYIINTFNQGVRVGNYKFPFSFVIQQDLPGTFQLKDNEKVNITYNLKACLVDGSGGNYPQQYGFNITIIEVIRTSSDYVQNFNASMNVVGCCNINYGQTILNISFPSYSAAVGSKIDMKINVNNQKCAAKINKIQVNIIKHIYVTSNNNHFRQWTTLLFTQYTKPILPKIIESINLQFMIPAGLNSTCFGQLTGVYYTIQTKARISDFLCGEIKGPETCTQIFLESRDPTILKRPAFNFENQPNLKQGKKIIFQKASKYMHNWNINLEAMNRRMIKETEMIELLQYTSNKGT